MACNGVNEKVQVMCLAAQRTLHVPHSLQQRAYLGFFVIDYFLIRFQKSASNIIS